jgi:hypothetical protein
VLGQNFEADGNLGGLIGSKLSKFEISDIHGSPTGENETRARTRRFTGRVRV